MIEVFKFFIRELASIIKLPFTWEIMPNISLGMFFLFFMVLGLIIFVLFYVVINKGGSK